jgi:hypothetical protein
MPQMIIRRPLRKLELADQQWFQPPAFLHLGPVQVPERVIPNTLPIVVFAATVTGGFQC